MVFIKRKPTRKEHRKYNTGNHKSPSHMSSLTQLYSFDTWLPADEISL